MISLCEFDVTGKNLIDYINENKYISDLALEIYIIRWITERDDPKFKTDDEARKILNEQAKNRKFKFNIYKLLPLYTVDLLYDFPYFLEKIEKQSVLETLLLHPQITPKDMIEIDKLPFFKIQTITNIGKNYLKFLEFIYFHENVDFSINGIRDIYKAFLLNYKPKYEDDFIELEDVNSCKRRVIYRKERVFFICGVKIEFFYSKIFLECEISSTKQCLSHHFV